MAVCILAVESNTLSDFIIVAEGFGAIARRKSGCQFRKVNERLQSMMGRQEDGEKIWLP